jgi:hypothetical protein
MKAPNRLLLITVLTCSIVRPAVSYERSTHAAITNSAYQASNLNFPSNGLLLQQLGLDVTTMLNSSQPFGSQYVSIQGLPTDPPTIITRYDFEFDTIQKVLPGPPQAGIPFWLMAGVIREDDVPGDPPGPIGLDANVDGDFYRVFNHFYDPVNNKPLNGLLVTPGAALLNGFSPIKAPDWATGAKDSFGSPNVLDPNTQNHFTVYDVHEALFRALTLQSQSSAGVITDLVDESTTSTYDATVFGQLQTTRNLYWATNFRALGDVLHLNQDMAQPQHTRNEPHSGLSSDTVQNVLTGHESVYERYIDARAQGKLAFTLKYSNNKQVAIDQIGQPPPALVYSNGYPIPSGPSFTQYSNFWSTTIGGNPLGANGLADYSNRGFFTAANNFNDHNYSLPSQSAVQCGDPLAPTTWNGTPLTGPPIHLCTGTVPESAWNGRADDTGIALTTNSVWDQFMEKQAAKPTFTLIRRNYDDMAGLLIPRATAYSAGLINFMYRGQMAISLPHEGVYGIFDQSTLYNNNRNTNPSSRTQGFTIIKLQLANTTPSGEAMSGGTLTAVLRFRRNLSFTDDLTNEAGAPSGGGVVGLTAVRGNVEELVVSTTTTDAVTGNVLGKVTVPTTPMELEFDFQRALPLNSTDVSLQVVYRGTLGSENDAVVVATSYISEPTYFSYINAFDYIRLGTHVYTRAQINAAPFTLLPLVRPTTCVDNSVSPPQLSAACFPANQTLTVTLDHKSPTVPQPLVVAKNIPTQNYLRIAVLTDGGQSGQSVLQQSAVGSDGLPCLPTDAFTIPALNNGYLTQVDSTQTPPTAQLFAFTDQLSTQRGILGWFTVSCVYNGDGTVSTPTTPPDDRAAVMANLTGQAIFPVQTTLTFPQPPQP